MPTRPITTDEGEPLTWRRLLVIALVVGALGLAVLLAFNADPLSTFGSHYEPSTPKPTKADLLPLTQTDRELTVTLESLLPVEGVKTRHTYMWSSGRPFPYDPVALFIRPSAGGPTAWWMALTSVADETAMTVEGQAIGLASDVEAVEVTAVGCLAPPLKEADAHVNVPLPSSPRTSSLVYRFEGGKVVVQSVEVDPPGAGGLPDLTSTKPGFRVVLDIWLDKPLPEADASPKVLCADLKGNLLRAERVSSQVLGRGGSYAVSIRMEEMEGPVPGEIRLYLFGPKTMEPYERRVTFRHVRMAYDR